jgi:hypothetical protein
MSEIISYEELAKRLDAVKLFNKAPELDPEIYDGLENGSLYEDEPCEWFVNKATTPSWCCDTHMYDGTGDLPATGDHPEVCQFGEDQEPSEIYQWYLISPSDADYMKRNTDELIFYSEVLDEYVWGVTHFGTPWSAVMLDFGKDQE